jgi:hypothetical protein
VRDDMQIHSKALNDNRLLVEMGEKLPDAKDIDNGRLFMLLNKDQSNLPYKLYMYHTESATWERLNPTYNLSLGKLNSSDGINYGLHNNEGYLGSTFANITLSPDNTYAVLSVKGCGKYEADGFILRNADAGAIVLKAGVKSIQWMGNDIISTKDFDPTKVLLNANVEVFKIYKAQTNETLFISTSKKVAIIDLPLDAKFGDVIKMVDFEGTFSVNKVTVKGIRFAINGVKEDYIINEDSLFTFMFLGPKKGWKVFKQESC